MVFRFRFRPPLKKNPISGEVIYFPMAGEIENERPYLRETHTYTYKLQRVGRLEVAKSASPLACTPAWQLAGLPTASAG